MADAIRGGIPFRSCRPHFMAGMMDFAMIEMLFIYQLARRPVQAVARRWCGSLFRATRGKRRCPESTKS